MRFCLFFIALFILPLLNLAQENKTVPLYVGTFTSEGAEGIYLCQFDPVTGSITLNQVFKGIDNPNFIRKSRDGRFLYAVTRSPAATDPTGGSVNAYRISGNGGLEFINKQSAQGSDPCHVAVSQDGKWVAIANYGGGSVALYPVSPDGALLPASGFVKHRGSGPHPSRQKAPYAHSVQFSKDGTTLYAADLGADQIFIYHVDKSAGLLLPAPQASVKLPPGSGPRHFCFSADEQFCYVANELNSTVSVLTRSNNLWNVVQTLSTLPSGFRGLSFCADIHLSPDETKVYVSNRGHQSIAIHTRNQDGTLKAPFHTDVKGDWPRNFIIDPQGKFMLTANQRSHNITVFELRDGIPVFTGHEISLPAPVCLEF